MEFSTNDLSVFGLVILASSVTVMGESAPGACSESFSAITITRDVVACSGRWRGHIRFANHICGPSFSVCSWEDKGKYLSQISWDKATQTTTGCYAYNAAQDGDTCSPCKDDLESDDLAAIGRDCPHKNFGQSGCLSSGKIEASCCVDAMRFRACHYRPGITTGVLCCRREKPARDERHGIDKPLITPPPPLQEVHFVGEKIHLKCPLMIRQDKQVTWNRNGRLLTDENKVSYYIPFALEEKSGLYSCQDFGSASVAYVNLTVKAVATTACRDGSSEGFHDAQNVRGCAGQWKGHVKKASREICGRNWRVCKPTDKAFLDQVDNEYFTNYAGCFAYNAMETGNRCSQCKNSHRKSMASFGSDCPINEKSPRTLSRNNVCYQRKIAPYSDKFLSLQGRGCVYRKGYGITGVLCCRKPSSRAVRHQRQQQALRDQEYQKDDSRNKIETSCRPQCRNGGTCLRDGRCLCKTGFHGIACQHGGCSPKCVNGGQCSYGWCRCEEPFYGSSCQHTLRGWHFSKPIEATTEVSENRLQLLPQRDDNSDFNEISNSIPNK